VKLLAEEFEIADAVKLGIVGNAGRAIAEADLGAQVDIDLDTAIGAAAAKCTAGAPLIERKRPFDFGPIRAMRALAYRPGGTNSPVIPAAISVARRAVRNVAIRDLSQRPQLISTS
jgi:hypothetical protein